MGEAFSLDAGGGVRWFDGTVTDYYLPEGQSQKFLQRKRSAVTSEAVVDAGVTVFPREWLRMRFNALIPVEDRSGASFGITLGLNHWFL